MARDKEEQARISLILDGKNANSTLRDLEAAARKARAELRGMNPDSAEFVKTKANLERINKELDQTKVKAGLAKSSMDKLLSEVKTSFLGNLGANLATIGIEKLATSVMNGIETFKKFQSSLKNLSAITGLSGADLKYLGDEAQKTSVKTGIAAKDVVEAYKLIASAKPELLDNKEALAQVTKEAITLSHASGLDLPEAAKRLTDAMNQFGAPAADAGRYVNVLAEAARLSAAEVPELSEALVQFGVAAKSSNISIEESSAMIETLAEKGVKGAEAGTKLRNVLVALNAPEVLDKKALEYFEKHGVNIQTLSDKTLPLGERLKELSKIQGDAGAIASVFGKENSIAAQILIENVKRVNELSAALGDKNLKTAYDQAALNTDTLTSAQNKFSAAWDNIMAKQGTIGAFLTFITTKFTNILVAVDNVKYEMELMFKSLKFSSQEAKEYLLDFGKTDSGKSISKYLETFDKMNNKEFYTKASENKKQFIDLMAKEGETAGDASILFDAYVRRRTNLMIESAKKGKNVGVAVADVKTPPTSPNKELTDDEKKGIKKKAKEQLDEFVKEMDIQIQNAKLLHELEIGLKPKDDVTTELDVLSDDMKKFGKMYKQIDEYNKNISDKKEKKDVQDSIKRKAWSEKEKNEKLQELNEWNNAVNASISSIMQAWDTAANNELQRERKKNNQKKAELAKQLESNLITQEQYNAKLASLDLQQESQEREAARKQAERQKQAAIFEALIKTTLAWIEAAIDPTGMSYPRAVAASIQLGALIATPLPEFYDGGFTGAGGKMEKGGFPAILHRNEYVINERLMKNPVVSAFAEEMEAVRTGKKNEVSQSNSNNSQVIVNSDPELKQLLKDLKNNGVKGVWNWDYEKRSDARMAEIESRRKF